MVKRPKSNPHGLKINFSEGALILAEGGYKWGEETNAGSLKIGGWYHAGSSDDVRRDSTGRSLAEPATSGRARTFDGNWGIYAGAEQILWKEMPEAKDSAQGVGVFSRLGYAPSDRNRLGFYAEGGVTRTGWIAGRDDDVCGLGVAYGQIGSETRSLVKDENSYTGTHAAVPDYEWVVELEYQIKVRPGFAVQPGVQDIIHPGGSAGLDNALIFSLRSSFDF